jgi:ubiquitin carboxyl-terminal hydrolase 14
MKPEEEDLPPVGPGLPAEFQGIYELFAVVTHKGRDADGGHYMSWVKADHNSGEAQTIADTEEANEDWFVFDDDEVSPCKTEDVLKLKGGGDWHMSYLNFYRAKK